MMTTSQLAIMLQSGVDLAEALQNVSEQCRHSQLKTILCEVFDQVSAGVSFSVALACHSDAIGGPIVAGVAAGEASGTLTEVLKRITESLRNEIRLNGTLKSILAYPLMLALVATGVVLALVLLVLPQFSQVFEDLGQPAPPLTQILLDSATWIQAHMLVIGIGLVVIGGFVFSNIRNDRFRRRFDRIALTAPVLAKASQALQIGRAYQLLGAMLQTGVPLLDGLQLCRKSTKNTLYHDLFDRLIDDVTNGRGVGKALTASNFVPTGAAQMVETAERSGRLGDVLQTVGQFYEDEGERHVRQLVKLMEPIVIVIMGVVVAGVVLAVMLPLLDVSTMSH
ncbi:type II secretion system F family protein [Thalassoroseus pseudoceratinae]|uniref:type II secretion system F family protein n=1 Tax=Thalassoroseus pseudoceratinae TaxID=2713176 RepID=UPI0014226998|nr:type II secretion system F family protein [Thalassoroseus pseudoceratinae]